MKVPKVTVREKNLLNNKISLYLDYYPPVLIDGKRGRRETLGLTVHIKPRNETQKTENKDARMQADFRRSERQKELNANPNINLITGKEKKDFVAFYRKICDEKTTTLKNSRNWLASLGYLELFTGGKLLFSDVTTDFVEDYQAFLQKCNAFEARTKAGKFNIKAEYIRKLSPNSIKIYLQLFGSAVKKAIKRKRLLNNPLEGLEKIKGIKPQKEFLTLPELKLLAETNADIPDQVRRASLFSALTGLRFSDIQQLKWANVRENGEEIFLSLRIKKTGEPIVHFISQEARDYLGARRGDDDQVFEGLKYSGHINILLGKWTTAAGINRKITFHCLRHTYSSLHYNSGTPVEVISELLAHSNIKTTQIYLHSLGLGKRNAANVVTLK